jgi:DNA-binding GntR family transcriptional regulator
MTAGPALPQITPHSLRHRVLHTLREAIISGQFQPGDRLVEEDICQQMGVSRGPVREALRQLEQEGLVVSFPYRATEVIGVSDEEVHDVLVPIRLTLERFAFRHALPLLNDMDFADLEQLVRAMRQAGEAGDLAGIVEADVRFHELVLKRSQQPHCAQLWRTISPRVRAYFYRCGPRHNALTDIADEHRELLDAMRTRELERVLAVLEPHIIADAIGGAAPPGMGSVQIVQNM